MNETLSPATAGTTHRLEWATQVTLPSGNVLIEPARMEVYAYNRRDWHNAARPGSAAVVYAEVTVGPWSIDLAGKDEFAVRREWPDGRIEYDAKDSRHSAEVRSEPDGSCPSARAVGRTVTRSPWTLAANQPATRRWWHRLLM